MTINEYIQEQLNKLGRTFDMFGQPRRELIKRVTCADGFFMSVQASETHYSTPRADFADHYDDVEVGYPSERDELLMPYAEDSDRPTATVYGYVPVEVVDRVIASHGGFAK